MYLKKLVVHNVRNINQATVNPSERINLIYGDNASGKSAFLESIFFLGRAKSFRTTKLNHVINHNVDVMTVYGELAASGNRKNSIGIQRKGKKTEIKISGNNISSLAELASLLPIQFIHPGSQQLFESGPGIRRKFIDWGLFHVEHDFISVWRSYSRALHQRNALLKSNKTASIQVWDNEITHYGALLTAFRKKQIKKLEQKFIEIANNFFDFKEYKLLYKAGWDEKIEFNELLKKNISSDCRVGFTQLGPHRSNLELIIDGRIAQTFVSRGQMKLLVLALNFAQAGIMSDAVSDSGCILIDDLSAELDCRVRGFVFDYLKTITSQVYMTSTTQDTFAPLKNHDCKLFHVEQGCIKLS